MFSKFWKRSHTIEITFEDVEVALMGIETVNDEMPTNFITLQQLFRLGVNDSQIRAYVPARLCTNAYDLMVKQDLGGFEAEDSQPLLLEIIQLDKWDGSTMRVKLTNGFFEYLHKNECVWVETPFEYPTPQKPSAWGWFGGLW